MAPFNDVRVHMSAPLHCYTTKVRSDFGSSGWLSSENDDMMTMIIVGHI
jgi:hypothetical protein